MRQQPHITCRVPGDAQTQPCYESETAATWTRTSLLVLHLVKNALSAEIVLLPLGKSHEKDKRDFNLLSQAKQASIWTIFAFRLELHRNQCQAHCNTENYCGFLLMPSKASKTSTSLCHLPSISYWAAAEGLENQHISTDLCTFNLDTLTLAQDKM